MIASGEDSPEALSGFVKFHPQYALRVPAWRKIEYYLARSAVSRTFFRKFFPAVPRAAGRPAFRASALRGGEFGIIRAPGAPGAGNPPAHRMPTTPARRSGGGSQAEGGIGLALRPAPHAGRPASPRSMSIDATAPEVRRLRASALRGIRFGRVHSTTYI